MAVALYKEGETHTIRGYKCEMVVVEIRSMESYLKNGYVVDPKILHEKDPSEECEAQEGETLYSGTASDLDEEQTTPEEPDSAQDGEQEVEMESEKDRNARIRKEAKEAGIEGFESSRIATLEKKLGYEQS